MILETAAHITNKWLQTASLQLALQESEDIVIINKRHHNKMDITIDGTQICTGPDPKYLGIQMDSKLSFTTHSKLVVDKTNKAVQNLMRIMLNVSAAKQGKSGHLSNVVHSLL